MIYKYLLFSLIINCNLFAINCTAPIANIADLYQFTADDKSKSVETDIQAKVANVANLYNFSQSAEHEIKSTPEQHFVLPKDDATKSNHQQQSTLANVFHPHTHQQNKTSSSTTTATASNASVNADISELYIFSSPTMMGIFNCSYDNTIDITNHTVLPNGSYVYDSDTLIPPHLVGNYNYEILYNGTKRSVPLHKRACICRLKPCITLCSSSIVESYGYALKQGLDSDSMGIFDIKITLNNNTVITKNIAKDFAHIVLDEFCYPFFVLAPEQELSLNWTLFENSTLLRQNDKAQLKNTEYCFEFYSVKIDNEEYDTINPYNCAKRSRELKTLEKLSYWIQAFSVPLFLFTLFAYSYFPELFNVQGKCFMTHLGSLTVSFSILSFINLSGIKFDPIPCLLLGYLNHYMQLSQYIWLGIICFDTWKSFSSDSLNDISYRKYAIIGYGIPLLMTLLTFWAEHSSINKKLKPGINKNRCGLEVDKWAASIYLYGPCTIILVYCSTAFILTSRIIKSNNKRIDEVPDFHCPRTCYSLYMRLFLMMGLFWFLDVISYLINLYTMKNLSIIVDYINGMQGLYIFVSFIGRQRVRDIMSKRFKSGRILNTLKLKSVD